MSFFRKHFWVIAILAVAAYFIGRYLYMKPRFIHGEPAPDFRLADLRSGDSLQLSDLQGHFVLLDFWGSWCGPCRGENPLLRELYLDFQGKDFRNAGGFEIVGIAIEQREQSWQAALERDRIPWPYHVLDHSSSLRFLNGPVAKRYGVKEVPTKYLLNPRGVIMGVNPSVEEIRKVLAGEID